jgi:hypothetical protein
MYKGVYPKLKGILKRLSLGTRETIFSERALHVFQGTSSLPLTSSGKHCGNNNSRIGNINIGREPNAKQIYFPILINHKILIKLKKG